MPPSDGGGARGPRVTERVVPVIVCRRCVCGEVTMETTGGLHGWVFVDFLLSSDEANHFFHSWEFSGTKRIIFDSIPVQFASKRSCPLKVQRYLMFGADA